MLLHFGSAPVLVVSSAVYAREIMKTHDLAFANRPKATIFEKLLYNKNDVSMAPYGEYWRQIRSICVLRLLSNKRVQSFRNVRYEELEIFMGKIEKSKSAINLSDSFASLTNDIICRVALGRKYGGDEDGKKFKTLLKDFNQLLGVFNVGDYIPSLGWINKINGLDGKVEKVAEEFDGFLEKVVEEHASKLLNKRDNDDDGDRDFVDVLLDIQKDGSAGFPLTRVSIKAIILDMFAAGTDTTSTLLEWVMTLLLRHPKVMEELQDEVRRTGNGKPMILEDDLERMHYLKTVIKETLRLHPPIPLLVPHFSTRDVKIEGYDIAAGTIAITNAWAIGRDPGSWDDPDEFKPKRFLNSAIDFKGHNFELIPFGAGRRSCPGILFAIAINELVLANLVYRFNWALPEGTKVEDLDMSESGGLNMHRKVPLFAVATPIPPYV